MDFTNKKEVLELALKVWISLARSGSSSKSKVLKRLGVYDEMKFSCPLCEYGHSIDPYKKCTECHKMFTWNSEINHCTDSDAYYLKWESSEKKADRHYWANKMVELIKYNIRVKIEGKEKIKLQ